MGQQTKSDLETYFQTGDMPTQTQFKDFIESYENLADANLLIGSDLAITAFAGSGQLNATQLTKKINNVAIVVSTGDSIKLPSATSGKIVYIRNSAANTTYVYPQLGEQIQGVPINSAVTLATTLLHTYTCVVPSLWNYTIGQ